eukprot:scaffold29463_cov148-Skeletonema_menzelii.AAC.2
MKIKATTTTSLALAIHPIAAGARTESSTFVATRDMDDSTNKNKGLAEKHSRLSSPTSAGDRYLAKERALPDVGVLKGRAQRSKYNKLSLFKKHRRTRFLEVAQEEAACLKPDTCEPELCACVANDGDAYKCAIELHAVCQGVTSTARNIDEEANTWTIGGCVDERRVEYYTNIYCQFAGCIANGGTYNQCSCDHFYQPYCELYGTTYAYLESVQINCEKADCCSAAEDDVGRGICLHDDTSAYKLSEDSLDPSLQDASNIPITIPNSTDQSLSSQGVPSQGVPSQGVLSQDQENVAFFTSCFGLTFMSALGIVSAFLFNTGC